MAQITKVIDIRGFVLNASLYYAVVQFWIGLSSLVGFFLLVIYQIPTRGWSVALAVLSNLWWLAAALAVGTVFSGGMAHLLRHATDKHHR